MRMLTSPAGLFSLREMDRLFERFLEPDFHPAMGLWTPMLDLAEGKEGVIVRVDVPGIDPKEIQITLQDQVLTIKGEKKLDQEEGDERFHRVERPHGAFARSVHLPVAVDARKVEATFKNGLLTIHVAKTPAGNGAAIPIKAG